MVGDERLKQKRNYLSRVISRTSRRFLSRGTDAVSRPVASPLIVDIPDVGLFIPIWRGKVNEFWKFSAPAEIRTRNLLIRRARTSVLYRICGVIASIVSRIWG
jgi:hypothetical protein